MGEFACTGQKPLKDLEATERSDITRVSLPSGKEECKRDIHVFFRRARDVHQKLVTAPGRVPAGLCRATRSGHSVGGPIKEAFSISLSLSQ